VRTKFFWGGTASAVSLFISSHRAFAQDSQMVGVNGEMRGSDARAIKNKVREFRERAGKAKLKAEATSEAIAKRMFEDAARQFEDMADNLEKHGRPY
jgi:predicted transcriptional regulator